MAKFLGRFRCTDNGDRMRRLDGSEEAFMSKAQSEGESDTPMIDNYLRNFEPSAMETFKAAIAKRYGLSQDDDEEEEREDSVMARQHRGELSGELTPIQRFQKASDARHGIARCNGARK